MFHGGVLLGGGDATQHLIESQCCWASSIYCFRDCLSYLYVVPFKICFPFSWHCIKFFFPLSISILYITTHLYKVFKFIYKMCIYIFVSLFDFFFFFFFAVWNPVVTKWTLIVALRISSINKSCFKSHYVKQDLKMSEGILATLSEQQWEPSFSPLNSQWDALPCALRAWTDRVQNFTCQNSQWI